MNTDEFADATRRYGTGLGGGHHGPDIAADEYGDVTVEEILFADQLHIGSLDHGIGRLNSSDETARFDHP